MADGGFIEALGAGNVGVAAPLEEHLPDELLLAWLQLGDSTVQSLGILSPEDVPQHIHIGGEKGIVQVESVQGAVAAGLLVVDVVLLPVQIDQDRPPIIGDLYLDSAGDELILDFHFCVLSAWGRQGGDTKMAGAYQPRTMHSQNGRTGSGVLITPLPAGRTGGYSILAHVRTQAAIFFISTGRPVREQRKQKSPANLLPPFAQGVTVSRTLHDTVPCSILANFRNQYDALRGTEPGSTFLADCSHSVVVMQGASVSVTS